VTSELTPADPRHNSSCNSSQWLLSIQHCTHRSMEDITMGPLAPSAFVALINSFHREQQQPCNEQCICRAITETLCNDLCKLPERQDSPIAARFEEMKPSVLLPRLSALLVASKQWQAGIQVMEGFVRCDAEAYSAYHMA